MSKSQREPVSMYDTCLTPGTLKLASTTEAEAILRSRQVQKVYATTTWQPRIVQGPQTKPVLKGVPDVPPKGMNVVFDNKKQQIAFAPKKSITEIEQTELESDRRRTMAPSDVATIVSPDLADALHKARRSKMTGKQSSHAKHSVDRRGK